MSLARTLANTKAVFFDAGGTLFHPYPTVGEIYSRVAAKHGCQTDGREIEDIFRAQWVKRDNQAGLRRIYADEKNEKQWWRTLVQEVFSHTPGFACFDDFFNELYDIFGSSEVWRLYPGVPEVLAELKKRGKCVGIVSNWDRRLFQIVEGLGLKGCVDFVIASAVLGAAKPGARIFEEALARARVLPAETVHIGDSLEDDVSGARGVGIKPILINRHPESRGPQSEALQSLLVIHDIRELIAE